LESNYIHLKDVISIIAKEMEEIKNEKKILEENIKYNIIIKIKIV